MWHSRPTIQSGIVELISPNAQVMPPGDVTVNSGGIRANFSNGQIASTSTLTKNGVFAFVANGNAPLTQTKWRRLADRQ